MLERDRQTIRRCSVVLCKQLVVDAMLIQSLQADDILTESMAESILGEQTSQKRSWHLLQLLPKRGPRAFRSFCAALRETEQQHLCDLLTQSPERDGREAQLKSIQPEEEPEGKAGRLLMQTPEKKSERFVDPSLPFPTQEVIAAKRARTRESMEFSLDADSPINSPVLPCTSDFYLSHCQQSYRMNSSPRGFALVISNVTFDPCAAPDLDPRKGGEVDDEVLRKVLTELDYLVTVHRDLTAQVTHTDVGSMCI